MNLDRRLNAMDDEQRRHTAARQKVGPRPTPPKRIWVSKAQGVATAAGAAYLAACEKHSLDTLRAYAQIVQAELDLARRNDAWADRVIRQRQECAHLVAVAQTRPQLLWRAKDQRYLKGAVWRLTDSASVFTDRDVVRLRKLAESS